MPVSRALRRGTSLCSAIVAASISAAVPSSYAQNEPQMIVGQAILFAGPYCPRGTLDAHGQGLNGSQYRALHGLYGNRYGGSPNGAIFQLPNLNNRTPIGAGEGPGLRDHPLATSSDAQVTTMTWQQLPTHTHQATMRAYDGPPDTNYPSQAMLADFDDGFHIYSDQAPDVAMQVYTARTNPTGGAAPIVTQGPYLSIRFCIVTQGIVPHPPQ